MHPNFFPLPTTPIDDKYGMIIGQGTAPKEIFDLLVAPASVRVDGNYFQGNFTGYRLKCIGNSAEISDHQTQVENSKFFLIVVAYDDGEIMMTLRTSLEYVRQVGGFFRWSNINKPIIILPVFPEGLPEKDQAWIRALSLSLAVALGAYAVIELPKVPGAQLEKMKLILQQKIMRSLKYNRGELLLSLAYDGAEKLPSIAYHSSIDSHPVSGFRIHNRVSRAFHEYLGISARYCVMFRFSIDTHNLPRAEYYLSRPLGALVAKPRPMGPSLFDSSLAPLEPIEQCFRYLGLDPTSTENPRRMASAPTFTVAKSITLEPHTNNQYRNRKGARPSPLPLPQVSDSPIQLSP